MGYAIKIYEAFRDLGEDKAQILAEFVEYIESRKSATSLELRETELRLTKEIEATRLEIEEVRKEIKEVELKLTKEIETTKLEIEEVRKEIKEIEGGLRKELKEIELKLTKEIEAIRLEIEEVRKEIKEVELKLTKEIEDVRREIKEIKADIIKWSFLFWLGQIASLVAIIKWLIIK